MCRAPGRQRRARLPDHCHGGLHGRSPGNGRDRRTHPRHFLWRYTDPRPRRLRRLTGGGHRHNDRRRVPAGRRDRRAAGDRQPAEPAEFVRRRCHLPHPGSHGRFSRRPATAHHGRCGLARRDALRKGRTLPCGHRRRLPGREPRHAAAVPRAGPDELSRGPL